MSSSSLATPVATVVLPTRNRADWLRRAIQSSFSQSVPVEVIVLDDASTDETRKMVETEFPHVRYHRNETPTGPCVLRNLGTRWAAAPFVFPIDDDAEFVSPNSIEQTLADFDHPRIAAVAIPFVNVNRGNERKQFPPDRSGRHIMLDFIGASHALRRDVFNKLGGYREHFFYMAEERDVCMRLTDAGYVTRLGRADPLHHHESPHRIKQRAFEFTVRNNMLCAWHNIPFPEAIGRSLGIIFNLYRYGWREGHLWWVTRGLAASVRSIVNHWSERDPMSHNAYRVTRLLTKRNTMPLDELESMLPPMRFPDAL